MCCRFPPPGIALSPGQLTEDGRKILKTDVQQFAEQLYRTRRFSELSLTGYVSETDVSAEQQFAAMTFLLPDKSPVVVFRGTDESLVGWKEDCNMSYLPSIPSQGKAVRYLNRIAARYPGDIHVVGHSKGGNLAIFASVGADPSVRARIRNVYSYDGPGFDESFVRSDAFSGVADRIVTFIPESSLVGGFFFRGGKTEYVLSAERGLMQHKPLSWYAVGDRLSRADGRSEFGKRMDDSIRNGIDTVPKEDRREFVELLFQLLGATKAETLGQLTGTGAWQSACAQKLLSQFRPGNQTAVPSALFADHRASERAEREEDRTYFRSGTKEKRDARRERRGDHVLPRRTCRGIRKNGNGG